MLCRNCNRVLLERYNGKTFCPKCGEDSSQQELMITPEGEDTFRLSELAYLRYLSPLGGPLNISNRERLLEDAIRLCSTAAGMGHPKAIFRMGYYYEFYHRKEKSEIERFYRSFDYYWRLCSPDVKDNYFKLLRDGVTSKSLQSETEWKELKEQAARHILALLEASPKTFTDSRYQNAKKAILKAYPHLDTLKQDAPKTSRVAEVYRVLCSCFSKKRPPLMGLFRITGAELRQLEAIQADESAGRKHTVKVIWEKMEIAYCRCQEDGTLKPPLGFKFIRSAEFPSDLRDEDHLYFLFFNMSGEHTHISSGEVRRMEREVFDEQSELVDFIGKSSRREFLLFHEDVVYMKRVLKGNFAELLDSVAKEG